MNSYLKRIDRYVRSGYALSLSHILPKSVAAGYYRSTNFGDLLTPDILNHFGVKSFHCPRLNHAEVVGVGSILQMLTSSYTGIILGSGLIDSRYKRPLSNAKALLVRGNKTKQLCGLSKCTRVGDPGLIADRVYHETLAREKSWVCGVVPHYRDYYDDHIRRLMKLHRDDVLLIDVRRCPRDVVRDISKCEIIISSSLHGLVISDSLGIPNIWVKFSDKIIGGDFKFDDYYSCFGVNKVPAVMNGDISVNYLINKAENMPRDLVDFRKSEIYQAFVDFTELI